MFVDKDFYGWYEKCLQCGYYYELRGLDEFRYNLSRKDKEAVGAPVYETRGETNDYRL